MNTELQILEPPGHLQPVPGANPPASDRRPRSKIARLPKKVRDSLNQMIQDGVPYDAIKQNLGDPAKDLTVDNISEWKIHGGYQAWYSEQIWRDEIGARLEAFAGPIADADPAQLSQVGLQVALVQLCEQLRQLGPGSRTDQFENNAAQYLRMLNTLARLTKSSLALQQYRDTAGSRASVPKLQPSSPSAAPAATDNKSWLDRADDLFGIKSTQRLVREAALETANPQPSQSTSPLSGADQGVAPQPDGLPVSCQGSQSPQPEGLPNSSRGSQSAETPGNRPATVAHPEGMPESRPSPQIKNQKSKTETPGRCHFCHADLPPLLPDGQRPDPHCQRCGTALHSPFNRHLYCPSCGTDLRIILVGGRRIHSTCPCCDAPLPPWPSPT